MAHVADRRIRLVTLVLVVMLSIRCDGCFGCNGDDDDGGPTSGEPPAGSYHAGVGQPCFDDYYSASWGCGGPTEEETCAEGLACCLDTQPGSTYDYVCAATARCATAGPGEYCKSDRDCELGYECVGGQCRKPYGSPCTKNIECVTLYCGPSGDCEYPPPPDAGAVDSSVGDADMAIRELGPDLTTPNDMDAGSNDADAKLSPDQTSPGDKGAGSMDADAKLFTKDQGGTPGAG